MQCFILLVSTLVPIAIGVIGFNVFLGVAGVFYYLAFLYYSLTKQTSKFEQKDDISHDHVMEGHSHVVLLQFN